MGFISFFKLFLSYSVKCLQFFFSSSLFSPGLFHATDVLVVSCLHDLLFVTNKRGEKKEEKRKKKEEKKKEEKRKKKKEI